MATRRRFSFAMDVYAYVLLPAALVTCWDHALRAAASLPARCWEKGDIYAADYEGWYCVDCEEFKVRPRGGSGALVTQGSNAGAGA